MEEEMAKVERIIKVLTLLPMFAGDQKGYNLWKQKLIIMASFKPEMIAAELIRLICLKFEEIAGEWIVKWFESFPLQKDPGPPPHTVINLPPEAADWGMFIQMLDNKFVLENIVWQYKEDLWNCKQGQNENI